VATILIIFFENKLTKLANVVESLNVWYVLCGWLGGWVRHCKSCIYAAEDSATFEPKFVCGQFRCRWKRKGRRQEGNYPLNFGLLENCWKIFLSNNFCPSMQNLGHKTSTLRKFRDKIEILRTQSLPSKICSVYRKNFNFPSYSFNSLHCYGCVISIFLSLPPSSLIPYFYSLFPLFFLPLPSFLALSTGSKVSPVRKFSK